MDGYDYVHEPENSDNSKSITDLGNFTTTIDKNMYVVVEACLLSKIVAMELKKSVRLKIFVSALNVTFRHDPALNVYVKR